MNLPPFFEGPSILGGRGKWNIQTTLILNFGVNHEFSAAFAGIKNMPTSMKPIIACYLDAYFIHSIVPRTCAMADLKYRYRSRHVFNTG